MCVDEKVCGERMDNMSKDISDIKDRINKHDDRLDRLEDSHGDIKVEIAQVKMKTESINEDTKDIKTDVKKILDKPAQYWDKIVLTGLGVIAGYLINLFLK